MVTQRVRTTGKGRFTRWAYGPQPIERLVVFRMLVPLAVLGFMSTRLVYADHWVGQVGFSVPDLGGDWRQPLYLAPLPDAVAWTLAGVMAASAVATSIGLWTRVSAALLGLTVAYVAVADRLATFTVTKATPALMLALCVSAAGARYGLDAWRARRRDPGRPLPTHAPGGPVRFIHLYLPVFYAASGLCKARGEWLARHDILWTHLHDSYQTGVSHALANHLPALSWPAFQWLTLAFEVGAPLWFALPWTRLPALLYGLLMHTMIGLMFGPVIWFSLLMISLLLAAYAPLPWLRGALRTAPGANRARPAASSGAAVGR